jgi:hypothetical protein
MQWFFIESDMSQEINKSVKALWKNILKNKKKKGRKNPKFFTTINSIHHVVVKHRTLSSFNVFSPSLCLFLHTQRYEILYPVLILLCFLPCFLYGA